MLINKGSILGFCEHSKSMEGETDPVVVWLIFRIFTFFFFKLGPLGRGKLQKHKTKNLSKIKCHF